MNVEKEKTKLLYLLLIIGLSALIMRVIVGEVLKSVPHHGALTRAYFTYADNLIDHGTFSGEKSAFPPDSFRPPMYPLFLAGIRLLSGREQWENWVAGIQYILGSASCVLIALLGFQVCSRQVGLIAGFLAVFYLDFIYISVPFLREILSIFLLLLMLNTFLLFIREKKLFWIYLSAFFFGIGILSRPEISLVGFLLVLFYWKELLKGIPLKKAALVLILALLPWMVWVGRNFRVHHQFVPFSTEGAWAFFMGQVFHPDVAVPDGDNRAMQIIAEGPTEMDWYRRMIREGTQAILDHPLRALYWVIPKLRITFQEYSAPSVGLLFPLLAILIPWAGFKDPKKRWVFCAAGALFAMAVLKLGKWDPAAPISLFQVSYTQVVILSALGFPLMMRFEKSGHWKVLAAPFLALILCNAITTSHLRQRVVLGDWVLMIWAAYLIWRTVEFIEKRGAR